MLDGIEALIALEKAGTVSEAAVQLRLTQSAVSKRIKALEAELDQRLIEADGRRVRLTPLAEILLAKAKPLISELKNLKHLREISTKRRFAIGIADSVASSWGPRLLKRALTRATGVELEIHVHRSLLIIERLRLGRYELGLVTGLASDPELTWSRITEERMVLVGPAKQKSPILTIETASATWREIGAGVLAQEKLKGTEFIFLESFQAAAQMAKEGFGRALVPVGTALAAGFRTRGISELSPKVARQVHLVARKSVSTLACIVELEKALSAAAESLD